MHFLTQWFKQIILASVLMPTVGFAMGVSQAQEQVLVQTSVWTGHYENRPYHNNSQELLNIEWIAPRGYQPFFLDTESWSQSRPWVSEIRWLAGGAVFNNSFSQRSAYLYGGGRYDFWQRDQTRAYAKVTLGLLHGYRGEFRDKIPLNHLGVAPAILPAIGLQHGRLNLEMIPFGAAGVMLNFGFYFPR